MTTSKPASGWRRLPTSVTATRFTSAIPPVPSSATPGALSAWVAETDNTIVGHIALHAATAKTVMTLACDRLNITADRIAVVARLLVSPQQRGQGAGRRLLATAATEAQARHLWPILDVDINLTAAITLYERAGWQRIGQASIDLPDGTTLHEAIYALNFNPAAT